MITFDQLEAEARRTVAADPDHIDQRGAAGLTCRYLDPDTGCGDCLFGRVYLALGMPSAFLAEWEFKGDAVDVWRNYGETEPLSDTRAGWMKEIQSLQDRGVAWHLALAGADEAYPLGSST